MKSRIFLVTALCALAFSSCTSLQSDRMLNSDGGEGNAEIATLAAMIVPLDRGATPEEIVNVRAFIEELERKPVKDTVFEARLASWSGRAYLIENKRNEAEKSLARSLSLIPFDIPSVILEARLEREPEARLRRLNTAIAFENASGELLVEKALTLRELKQYRECAAAFDSAFPLLESMYRGVYEDIRNTAWNLRDLAPGEDMLASVMVKDRVSWKDTYEVLKEETQLLSFLTGGKDWSAEKIHTGLISRSFVPSLPDGKSPPVANLITREEAAFLIWHLIAQQKGDQEILARYSKRWSGASGRTSPIPDVLSDSRFFDAVMGCIEGEIMNLPDGQKFFPKNPVSGSELIRMLKKAAQ
jgi:hypothetical protein